MLREHALRWTLRTMLSRLPDFEIGPPEDRYLQRWIVFPWGRYDRGSRTTNAWQAFKRSLPNVYLHRIRHDDEDRALHDHPWRSASWLLRGSYTEVMFYPLIPERIEQYLAAGKPRPTVNFVRPEGAVVFRRATDAHRLVLNKASGRLGRTEDVEVISMFFTGFVIRGWGFLCPKRWVPWREFVDGRDRGAIGKGCGD